MSPDQDEFHLVPLKTNNFNQMKTITSLLLGAMVLLLGATSCIDDISVSGNGIQATESRTTSAFSQVKSLGSFDVFITNGEEYSVMVSADENLLQYIETYVSGETLKIDIDELHSVKAVVPMEVYITTPVLNGIVQSGSGRIIADYFETDHFDAVLSGSGRIIASFEANSGDVLLSGSGKLDISGGADHVDLVVSGSGNIDASDLAVNNCKTLTSGSGNMWISVDDYLEARISGSGNVHYYGSPTVDSHISGSGHVISHQ